MNLTTLRLVAVAAMTAAASTVQLSAHKTIDGLIQEVLSGSDKKIEVIYSEQRDPHTHKIINSSHMIESKDKALFNRFVEAIKADRNTSVNYSQVGNEVISIAFVEGQSMLSYSLILDDDGSWMLSTSTKPAKTKAGVSDKSSLKKAE